MSLQKPGINDPVPDWDGIGLPPVGSVVLTKDGHKVQIYYHMNNSNGGELALYAGNVGKKIGGVGVANFFRPIKTERESMIDSLKQYCEYPGSWNSTYKPFAEALYDAGMLKEGA